jgi:hypothetical protein
VIYLPPMVLGPLFLWLERGIWQHTSFMHKLAEF